MPLSATFSALEVVPLTLLSGQTAGFWKQAFPADMAVQLSGN
jgi:nitric oxide reductase large subunit